MKTFKVWYIVLVISLYIFPCMNHNTRNSFDSSMHRLFSSLCEKLTIHRNDLSIILNYVHTYITTVVKVLKVEIVF